MVPGQLASPQLVWFTLYTPVYSCSPASGSAVGAELDNSSALPGCSVRSASGATTTTLQTANTLLCTIWQCPICERRGICAVLYIVYCVVLICSVYVVKCSVGCTSDTAVKCSALVAQLASILVAAVPALHCSRPRGTSASRYYNISLLARTFPVYPAIAQKC